MGVGQESKLQEWFHLPEDMASPRCFFSSSLVVNFTAWPLGAVETKTLSSSRSVARTTASPVQYNSPG